MVSKESKETSDNLQMLESADEIPNRRGAKIPVSFHHPGTIMKNYEIIIINDTFPDK